MVDKGNQELEERLLNGRRILNGFIPFFGPFFALYSGYRINKDFKEKIRSEREAIQKEIEGVFDDERKLVEEEYSQSKKENNPSRDNSSYEFNKSEYEKLNRAIEEKYGPLKRIVDNFGYRGLKALRDNIVLAV